MNVSSTFRDVCFVSNTVSAGANDHKKLGQLAQNKTRKAKTRVVKQKEGRLVLINIIVYLQYKAMTERRGEGEIIRRPH